VDVSQVYKAGQLALLAAAGVGRALLGAYILGWRSTPLGAMALQWQAIVQFIGAKLSPSRSEGVGEGLDQWTHSSPAKMKAKTQCIAAADR
jgi:hypothetical protein